MKQLFQMFNIVKIVQQSAKHLNRFREDDEEHKISFFNFSKQTNIIGKCERRNAQTCRSNFSPRTPPFWTRLKIVSRCSNRRSSSIYKEAKIFAPLKQLERVESPFHAFGRRFCSASSSLQLQRWLRRRSWANTPMQTATWPCVFSWKTFLTKFMNRIIYLCKWTFGLLCSY